MNGEKLEICGICGHPRAEHFTNGKGDWRHCQHDYGNEDTCGCAHFFPQVLTEVEKLDWKAEDEAAERFAAIHEKQGERWQKIGRWYEEYFSLKFMDGNLPKPQDALLGSRLRIQISIPHGDWVDWRRDGKYE